MELTRAQKQHIVNVLADIWGRENGVKLVATLPDEDESKPVQEETSN